uniref:Uncharacterized protein n=1 Tax=Anguilla anguilla TaxID=7936 RepID=A0A0E9TB13_ANGAN
MGFNLTTIRFSCILCFPYPQTVKFLYDSSCNILSSSCHTDDLAVKA